MAFLNCAGPKTDHVTQTGAQCNLPPDDSGGSSSISTSSSESDEDIEGTENITVAKRYLNRNFSSEEDIYTAPTPHHKWF